MKNISVCGIDCAIAGLECNKNNEEFIQTPCKGCNDAKGKLFWTKYLNLDVCPIYSCVKAKRLNHCGECEQLPCNVYFGTKDPSLSDEEHQQYIKDRVETLKAL